MRVSSCALVLKATLLAVLAAVQVSAFWRMPCLTRTGLARMDPLVNNGSISEHVHAIHGSGGFGISAGYDALMASDCTSCRVTQDKSVYWHPALYFHGDDGKYNLVEQVGGMLAYYFLQPNAGNNSLSAFPAGFEMIAGETNQRNFTYPVPDVEKSHWTGPYAEQTFFRQAAVGFNCLDYKKDPEGSLYRHFLPDKAYLDANCHDGIRFELMFPSCWNGKDRTSHDKKSHVAYPNQVMTGECPPEFPERLPGLFYETIWATNAFKGKAGQFVISNGDPTGYGYHGDFIMGWDEKFLQAAVDTCTNLSGLIEDCPIFHIQSSEAYSACKLDLPPALAKEDVLSDLPTMPGNPVIAKGPGFAGGAEANGAKPNSNGGTPASVAAPVLDYTPGTSLASSATYAPGAIIAQQIAPPIEASPTPVTPVSTSMSSSAPGAYLAVAEPTPTPIPSPSPSPPLPSTLLTTSAPPVPPPPPAAEGAPLSTQFHTHSGPNGVEVDELIWVLDLVTVTINTPRTTQGVYPDELVGAEKEIKMRHLHNHQRRRHL